MADAIARLLTARGVEQPVRIHRLQTVGSTNDWLKERAREAPAGWTAVVADVQTGGRGRHGNRWLSEPGDLFLSALVRPALPRETLTLLPLLAGVAVAEAVFELGVTAALKWPNDVVVQRSALDGRSEAANPRKLAGILVEGISEGPETLAAVVGVGLNLALDPRRAPPELAGHITSVAAETGRQVERDAAAAAVLERLARWYHALAAGEAGDVVQAWTSRSLPWWGRAVEVRSADSVLRGTARGIDARGALILELEDGTSAAVVSGEARQARLSGPAVNGP